MSVNFNSQPVSNHGVPNPASSAEQDLPEVTTVQSNGISYSHIGETSSIEEASANVFQYANKKLKEDYIFIMTTIKGFDEKNR